MKLLRQLLPQALCAAWQRQTADVTASLPLTALALDADEVLQVISASAAAAPLVAALGPAPWCNLAQSWLRHGRPPHSWHQDGALRHEFLAHAGQPAPADAALEMHTLWIALTPCGEDAPSLQWVDAEPGALLSPDELTPAAVAARYGEAAMQHAVLQPGDALLLDGLCLHRTHLTPAMKQLRCSLELRFFKADALPARVAGDAGTRLPASSNAGDQGFGTSNFPNGASCAATAGSPTTTML